MQCNASTGMLIYCSGALLYWTYALSWCWSSELYSLLCDLPVAVPVGMLTLCRSVSSWLVTPVHMFRSDSSWPRKIARHTDLRRGRARRHDPRRAEKTHGTMTATKPTAIWRPLGLTVFFFRTVYNEKKKDMASKVIFRVLLWNYRSKMDVSIKK